MYICYLSFYVTKGNWGLESYSIYVDTLATELLCLKSFTLYPGVLCLLSAFMKLWKVNFVSCKWSKSSGPSHLMESFHTWIASSWGVRVQAEWCLEWHDRVRRTSVRTQIIAWSVGVTCKPGWQRQITQGALAVVQLCVKRVVTWGESDNSNSTLIRYRDIYQIIKLNIVSLVIVVSTVLRLWKWWKWKWMVLDWNEKYHC